MDLKELHSFKMSDAVTFHDNLNPKLFRGQHLRPEVELQLKTIAEDFLQEMGIHDLDVRDITISGSNAAYSYTDHSDLDLHILVNMADLPDDEVYREFFKAKKDLYNDSHDITIHGIPVELYIQDAAEPVVSLGEYSIKDKKWLKIPTKRRANFDQTATKAKYEKLLDVIKTALKTNKISKIQKVLKKIKQYRQAGLDKGGEFGPENLAYKALRSQGYITKLYDLRDKLHSQHLTIENMYQDPVKIQEDNLAEKFAREFNQQEVDEARTNPDQNIKYESGMKELEAIANNISDPENWAVSMTSEPKLGINPQVGISEDTPKGIYFYPLNYAVDIARRGKKLPWGHDYPYIQLFQYDRSGEMTQQTKVDPAKLKQALLQYCPEEVIQQTIDEPEYDGTPYYFIYDCLSRLGKSDETNVVRWNKVLRDLGFTSVYDPGNGWIAYNEPTQGVVLDPRIIKQHKTIANRKESKVITPARIAQLLFDEIDMELTSNRIWQLYDPDGSKLRQAVKKYAEDPKFKPYMGKPGSQELEDEIKGYRLYGARQLSDVAMEWYKAQQPVNEAFDQPYRLKWEHGDYGDVDAYAKLDDGNYLSIMFNKGYNQDKEEAWNVEFFRNNSQEVTGEGDAQRVFATVLSAIHKFIKKYKPNKVIFSASKEVEPGQNAQSRARLYDSLVQRYSKAWGYRAFRADTGNKVIYELSRRIPVAEEVNTDFFNDPKNIDETIDAFGYKFTIHKTMTKQTEFDNDGNKSYQDVPGITIKAYDPKQPKNTPIGYAKFVKETNHSGETWVSSDETEVSEKYRSKGIATMMYTIVKSLGFDIRPSLFLSNYGERMWDKWGKDAKHLDSMAEASGYIPSEKEKNDPRFKTALTVDVKPDSIKKNAKSFYWNTTRAGIPPTAKPSGKI